MLFCSAHFHFTDHPEDLLLTYGRVAGLLLVVAVWWELLRRGAVGVRWLWLGVGLVAAHQQVHAWTAGGLETHFFNFLVFVAVARFLREEFTPAYARCPWSAVVMSLALLTRPEGYLFGGVCGLVLVLRRTIRSTNAPCGWRRVFELAPVSWTHQIARKCGRSVSWQKRRDDRLRRDTKPRSWNSFARALIRKSGKTVGAICRDLDLTETAVRRWVQQAEVDSGGGPAGALTTAEREELAQLRRRVKTLEMEREILKKATAFFAKESK